MQQKIASFICMVFILVLSFTFEATAQSAGHPSFSDYDMMDPWGEERQAHKDSLEAQALEWQQDWYSYTEERYGFNQLITQNSDDQPDTTLADSPTP